MASNLLDFSGAAIPVEEDKEEKRQPIGAAQQRVAAVESANPIMAAPAEPATPATLDFTGAAMPVETAAFSEPEQPPEEQDSGVAKLIMGSIVRPTLQGAGAVVGGIAGAGAGTVLGGPGVGTTVGGVGGGGLGYAIGDELADLLENALGMREQKSLALELTESGKEILEGVALETGGAVFGKVAGEAIKRLPGREFVARQLQKLPALRAKVAERKAGSIMAANLGKTNIIAKNIEEAAALEEAVPGLKFSRAQMTDDPNVIRFEKALRTQEGEFATQHQQRTVENVAAIKNFLRDKKGAGAMTDTRKVLEAEKQLAETGVMTARKRLAEEAAEMEAGQDVIEAGQTIRGVIRKEERAARRRAGALFDTVGDVDYEAGALVKAIDEISQPLSKIENVDKNVPEAFGRLKKVFQEQGDTVSIQDLQGFRSELQADLRQMRSATDRNRRKEARVSKFIKVLDDFVDVADELIPDKMAARQLRKARTAFRKDVIERFQTGNVDKILQQGTSGNRVSDAQIVKKFLKPGAIGKESAGEFMRAIGDNQDALRAMKDAVRQDLLQYATHPTTKEIVGSKMDRWMLQHKPALKRMGLDKEFDTVAKARKQLDDAIDIERDFAKSEASKLLDASVGREVDKALASPDMGKAMIGLLRRMKGDKRAIQGVQNDLIDKLMEIEPTKIHQIKTHMKKYAPAYRAAFVKDKAKLRAMTTYQKALERLKISEKNVAAGSETAEKLFTAIGQMAGMASGRVTTIAKLMAAPLDKMSKKEVNSILMKASLDPDFAYNLVANMKAGKVTDQAMRSLWGRQIIRGAGIVTLNELKRRTQGEQ